MQNFIVSANVTKLFGYIDFKISGKNLLKNNALFIYAENGMGKTTFLDILFALISTQIGEGLKGSLRRTTFRKVSVEFSNGIFLSASRSGENLEGDYELKITNPNNSEFEHITVLITADESGRVTFRSAKNIDTFYEKASPLLPDVIYLNADRSIRSSNVDQYSASRLSTGTTFDEMGNPRARRNRQKNSIHETMKQYQIKFLEDQIENFKMQSRHNVFTSQNRGIRGSDGVFRSLLKPRTATTKMGAKKNKDQLLEEIAKLNQNAQDIFKFRFAEPRQLQELQATISSIEPKRWDALEDIANLYVDTSKLRYSSLSKYSKHVRVFIDELNSYAKHKEFSYNLDEGIEIENKLTQSPLKFAKLSSGERHLLLILTIVAISRNRPTLLMIDEPEISLSTIWQRKLTNSLNKISAKNNIQFLIATHSIEILSDKADSIIYPEIT